MTAIASERTADEARREQLVSELTDAAITRELSKLKRMIAGRQEDIADLNHEVLQLQAKHDALIDEAAKRLLAQKAAPAASGDRKE